YDLVTWNQGTFHFALDDLKPIDDIAVVPGDVIRHLNLDTQMVVLDALRIFDERSRQQREQRNDAPAARSVPPITPMPVTGSAPAAAAYQAGALAVLPAELELVAACFRSVTQNRQDLMTGGSRADGISANFAKLRRIVGDLRSGLISTTISLSLMNIISESVERAVLFLVRREGLTALGAFGNSPGGQSLAQLTRGLKIELA